jgi:hypothetical protein
MEAADLNYASLVKRIAPQLASGRSESASFLNWFLENIYRLDEVSAADSICDAGNDKGIDGIYVDTNNEEIHFFQAKIRQNNNGTIGDVAPKTFSASVNQFSSPEKVEAILAGDAAPDLKSLVSRLEVKDLLAKGYKPVGVYVSNETVDAATEAYAALDGSVRFFDRNAIAAHYVETDKPDGVKGKFSFDVSYVAPLEMTIAGDQDKSASVYVFPAKANELVALDGVSDGTLFTNNVRFNLGNTPVNKSIKESIEKKGEHKNFSLFHNGVIILCSGAKLADDTLTIEDYSVVNGAQSISTFYNSKARLTEDLRVLVRVIALRDEGLGRKITEYSNNQNAIKPRDLRSNHALMTRLQNEMTAKTKDYFFEIKRGEEAPPNRKVIGNDEAGRALLAFDLLEPWSCHQIYKIFDEKYAEIFGRVEVDYQRILFVTDLAEVVESCLGQIENVPLGHYALTKYFLLYTLSRALREVYESVAVVKNPASLDTEDRTKRFIVLCAEIVKGLVVDLNYEVKQRGVSFDYKALLKSPKQSEELASELLRSYAKDVARGRASSFAGWK